MALLERVGFQETELVGETGFNSSPKTKGVLLRAVKPATSARQQKPSVDTESGNRKMHAMERKTPPSIEAVLDKAYAMGV